MKKQPLKKPKVKKDVIEEINFKTKPYKRVKTIKNLWNFWRKYNKRIFIVMFSKTGGIECFYVFHNNYKFGYNNGAYLIDREYMYWSDALNTFVSLYYEEISIPIKTNFDIEGTIDNIKHNLKGSSIEENVNPNILKSFVNSEVVQKLMRGEEFEKFMNKVFTIGIITMVTVIVVLIVLFAKLF